MKGKTTAEARAELEKSGMAADKLNHILPHKVFEGNKPSNSIIFQKVSPFNLGMLIGKKPRGYSMLLVYYTTFCAVGKQIISLYDGDWEF